MPPEEKLTHGRAEKPLCGPSLCAIAPSSRARPRYNPAGQGIGKLVRNQTPMTDSSLSADSNVPQYRQPRVPLSPYLILVCLVGSTGGFLFGFDTSVISGVIEFISSPKVFGL